MSRFVYRGQPNTLNAADELVERVAAGGKVVIESGVPVPPKLCNPERDRRYPVWLLEPGQSFEITGDPAKISKALTQAAWRRRQIAPAEKFAVRRTGTGARIWRLE